MANGERFAPRLPRLFLDDPAAAAEGALILRGSLAHRLRDVLRLRRDDHLEVIDEDQDTLYRARVTRLTADRVEAEVVAARPLAAAPAPPVVLCPALIRAVRFDFVVEKATELGVDGFRPLVAERSLVQGQSRLGRWRRIITEASEQCRRERRPWVEAPVPTAGLVSRPPVPGGVRLMASELERSQRIGTVLAAVGRPTAIDVLVGPEGGFSPEERAMAEAHGWRPVTLGPRPLRAETAAIVAVAVVLEALVSA
jgi:16S rRNA (uracil1498-N3)-methyltransferase